MAIDKKILSEIQRYNSINKYIFEQDLGGLPPIDEPAPAPEAPAGLGADPAAAPGAPAEPQPIDVENDPDVEKIDDNEEDVVASEDDSSKEELDVTDLVKSQENIETKQEQYFNNLFSQIQNLEGKLKEMDFILNKLNSLEMKIEKYREKTPQEKLELRTYDSYPFNQKLSDFFDDKKGEMEKTGKNDYVLTSDDVVDMNGMDMKQSFLPSFDDNM